MVFIEIQVLGKSTKLLDDCRKGLWELITCFLGVKLMPYGIMGIDYFLSWREVDSLICTL